MEVEISKDQKEALSRKIRMCVDFLKSEIQPHLISSDRVVIPMGEVLDLCISRQEIYVTKTRVICFIIDWEFKRVLYLEKLDRKMAKKYICDAYPELAVDFLKHWENAKLNLLNQVCEKNKKIDALNTFVDNFRL